MQTGDIFRDSIIMILLVLGLPMVAQSQWTVEYDASSHVFPEDNSTGWVYSNNGTGFSRDFVDDLLHVDTTTGDPYRAEGWINSTGALNFSSGFIMEARLQMLSNTTLYDEWGGAEIYARDDIGYNIRIDLDTDEVILGTIYDYVSFPMTTSDTMHTYRAEAYNNIGYLYVDGVQRLSLPLQYDNPLPMLTFGDQGWEGGNMEYEFVRYAVPEPATGTAGLLLLLPLAARRRRK